METPSLWSPLSIPAFRTLWIAFMAESICSWLLDMTNGWVMTSVSPSPAIVALVQTASLSPILLFALPSGALSDILNRKTILLCVEGCLAIVTAALAALVYFHLLSAWLLLLFIFINGAAFSFAEPVWQTVQAEVVPPAQQPAAFLLSGLAMNMARGVGPALAGVLLATTAGAALSYGVTALGFVIAFVAVFTWPATVPTARYLSLERVVSALIGGVRYARNEPTLRIALARVLSFVLFASAFWAVAPLVGRRMVKLDAFEYGLWMAAFGTGAILGGYVMSKIATTVRLNVIVASNTAAMAIALCVIANYPNIWVAYLVMFVVGGVWMMTLGSFIMSVQTNVPSWLRGRAMAIYFMVFQGTMALAAAGWGMIAEHWSIRAELQLAAAGLLLSLTTGIWWKLSLGHNAAQGVDGLFPFIPISPLLETNSSAALVTFDYQIRETDRATFLGLMDLVRIIRERNGVGHWGIYEDIAKPGSWREEFVVDSLTEMERIRQRTTTSDYALLQQVYALHQGPGENPTITRFVTPPPQA